MTRQAVIAYWLIPAEPAHTFFHRVIDDLARRFDAPVFEPHVTLHVGADRADSAQATLAEAEREYTPIKLKPLGIQESDEFVKTLFVQFALTAELCHVKGIIRHAAQDSSQYQLKPHVSLLYNKMEAAVRRELAVRTMLPDSRALAALVAKHGAFPDPSQLAGVRNLPPALLIGCAPRQ